MQTPSGFSQGEFSVGRKVSGGIFNDNSYTGGFCENWRYWYFHLKTKKKIPLDLENIYLPTPLISVNLCHCLSDHSQYFCLKVSKDKSGYLKP